MDKNVSTKKVNWRGSLTAEVLIISDFPTHEEEVKQTLLDCDGGLLLEKSLPIPISDCLLASMSQYNPANNDFNYLEGTESLRQGIKQIKDFINYSKTLKLIILLGPRALYTFFGESDIYKWRGSPLFYSTQDGRKVKMMATHHPTSEVLSVASLYPIFSFDIQKSIEYLEGKERIYNDRFTITADPLEQHNLVPEIIAASHAGYITCDIETRRNDLGLLCVGFGLSAERAICFVCTSDSTLNILKELFPKLGKVAYHNCLFDIPVLRFTKDTPAGPCSFDTMVAQHVAEPELPKGLDFLCSTRTWRPCYWADISFDEDSKSWSDKAAKRDSLYTYNCLDCVVTYEAMESFIEEGMESNKTFQYEMSMLEVSMHIGSTGFLVDTERRDILYKAQKEKWLYDYTTLGALAGRIVNIASPVQVKNYLYTELELPPRKNRKGGITTDADALVSLIGFIKEKINGLKTAEAKAKWGRKLAAVRLILALRGYEKMISSYLDVTISNDGRIRSTWKVTGTETGRWSCALWIDRTGFNAQTLPRESIEVEMPDLVEASNTGG